MTKHMPIGDPLVAAPRAAQMLGGVHRKTLDAWVRAGRLPPPTRLTRKVVGWRLSVLEAPLTGEPGATR